MSIGSQEWISESLARLETLEQERDAHEAELERANDADALRAHSEAIDRLDEEIRRLYAALEAVAAEDDDAEADDAEPADEATATNEFQREAANPMDPSGNAPFGASQPTDLLPSEPASPFAAAPASPFAAAPASPFAAAPAGPFAAAPGQVASAATEPAPGFAPAADFADYASEMDDEISSGGGKGKWLVAALGVAAVAGVVAWTQMGRAPAAPAPVATSPAEVQVIKASAVPPDTQGPKSAEGADVSQTPEREYTKSERRSAPRARSRSGGNRPQREAAQPEDSRKLEVGAGSDPFG